MKYLMVNTTMRKLCTADTNVRCTASEHITTMEYSEASHQLWLERLKESYREEYSLMTEEIREMFSMPHPSEREYELEHNAFADVELSLRIDAFKKDINEVCKKHKLYLSHEDCHGSFLISQDDTTDWFNNAGVE